MSDNDVSVDNGGTTMRRRGLGSTSVTQVERCVDGVNMIGGAREAVESTMGLNGLDEGHSGWADSDAQGRDDIAGFGVDRFDERALCDSVWWQSCCVLCGAQAGLLAGGLGWMIVGGSSWANGGAESQAAWFISGMIAFEVGGRAVASAIIVGLSGAPSTERARKAQTIRRLAFAAALLNAVAATIVAVVSATISRETGGQLEILMGSAVAGIGLTYGMFLGLVEGEEGELLHRASDIRKLERGVGRWPYLGFVTGLTLGAIVGGGGGRLGCIIAGLGAGVAGSTVLGAMRWKRLIGPSAGAFGKMRRLFVDVCSAVNRLVRHRVGQREVGNCAEPMNRMEKFRVSVLGAASELSLRLTQVLTGAILYGGTIRVYGNSVGTILGSSINDELSARAVFAVWATAGVTGALVVAGASCAPRFGTLWSSSNTRDQRGRRQVRDARGAQTSLTGISEVAESWRICPPWVWLVLMSAGFGLMVDWKETVGLIRYWSGLCLLQTATVGLASWRGGSLSGIFGAVGAVAGAWLYNESRSATDRFGPTQSYGTLMLLNAAAAVVCM